MTFKHPGLRRALGLLCSYSLFVSTVHAANLDFTVTTSDPVIVTGTPRIAIQLGGPNTSRTVYATYLSGSGSSQLIFRYAVQQGDFDANGITVVSPILVDGSNTIRDAAGNDATPAFTPGDTTGIRIQTYSPAFTDTTTTINGSTASAVSFRIFKLPASGFYTYKIVSDGGTESVIKTEAITTAPTQLVTADVSSLKPGKLTLSVYVTDDSGQGSTKTASATVDLDNVAPTGYGITLPPAYITDSTTPTKYYINGTTVAAPSFTITNGETGAKYNYSFSSTSGTGSPIGNSSDPITSNAQTVTAPPLTDLPQGQVTLTVRLTDAAGNIGPPVTATLTKDTIPPTIASVTPPANGTYDDL